MSMAASASNPALVFTDKQDKHISFQTPKIDIRENKLNYLLQCMTPRQMMDRGHRIAFQNIDEAL
jgi:hypothetical protein